MDIVYKSFLDTFHYEHKENENKVLMFSDFFKTDENILAEFGKEHISITDLKNGKFFVSNCRSKGFFLEQNSDIDNLAEISIEYKNLQKAIGKATDLFGFTNRYFENIIELFSNDIDSKGLGEFTSEFLERSNNKQIVGNININNLYTIGYEGNGNRILLDKDNNVYIYAHDLATRFYRKIDEVPQNTFMYIPKLQNLNDFVINFFNEFLCEE